MAQFLKDIRFWAIATGMVEIVCILHPPDIFPSLERVLRNQGYNLISLTRSTYLRFNRKTQDMKFTFQRHVKGTTANFLFAIIHDDNYHWYVSRGLHIVVTIQTLIGISTGIRNSIVDRVKCGY